jgi:pyruvate kinase
MSTAFEVGRPRPGDLEQAYASGFAADVARRAATSGKARRQQRRTRIVATIGPASDSPDVLRALAAAGMDVARVTLAHGGIEEAIGRVRRLREVTPDVGVLVDLPGPKIRAAPFPEGGVSLEAGSEVLLVAAGVGDSSTSARIGVAAEEVVAHLEPGDVVALGDGGVSLVVVEQAEQGATARVRSGGRLQGRPGVTAPARSMQLSTPTAEDLERLETLVAEGVDLVAVSFVRRAEDMVRAREAAGPGGPMLVAKIETRDAIDDLDRILEMSDAVMVARGDLGVRVPLEDVPHHQKHIIRTGVRFGLPVITATQMLESMVTAPVPTRAEVTDVANAVLDGTSAVMLSAETAVGVDPANAVATMARIVARTEANFDYVSWGAGLGVQQVSGPPSSPARITAAITGAAWRAAVEQDAAAIIACTRSGATARAISRFRPVMPIVATTPSPRTARQLSLSWGVDALGVPESESTDDVVWFAVKRAVEAGYAAEGDVVVVLAGSPDAAQPVADTLRLVRVR